MAEKKRRNIFYWARRQDLSHRAGEFQRNWKPVAKQCRGPEGLFRSRASLCLAKPPGCWDEANLNALIEGLGDTLEHGK